MSNNGKMFGAILIGTGALIFVGGAAVVISSGATAGGMVLGIVLSMVVAIPAVIGGIVLIVRSGTNAGRQADAARQRKILDVVKTQGQVDISELVFETNSNTEQIRNDVYKLVGMGLFTGYVNWDKGMLYSKEASQMKLGSSCPNCGGEMALGGKGVVTCQYCGTDVFL